MKLTRIMLTILLITSLTATTRARSILNDTMYQPITPATAYSTQQNAKSVNNDSISVDQIDLKKLAAERNAQMVYSQQVSRGYTPQKELIGEFRLTFYSPSADETDNSPFITATGARVKPGITVAVDPRYWKLGTKFYIEGYGYVIADDTGSMIKGPRTMDVCVQTKGEALKNGIQYREVWVVKS
jgi:3D (Asp-Asp-Asp) domain-containing protein